MKPIVPIEQASIFYDGTFSEPRLSHPEGLAFDKDGNLWCGGEQGQIYKIDPLGTSIELVTSTEGFSLGMAFDSEENLYVCDNMHKAVFKLNTKTNELQLFSNGSGRENMRIPNYPVVDHQRGCLYVSDSHDPHERGPGVWKIDLTTGKTEWWYQQPMQFANGLALTLDDQYLLVAETFANRISRIPILEDGSAGVIEEIATIDALPDGLAVDTEGNIYVSCYEPSCLYRIRTDHQVELLIHDKEAHTLCHPTNCAFKGEDLYTTNLGRWHITKFHVGIAGPVLI
jgi:gluconolactonase